MTQHGARARHFYDDLAADYDLMYADWDASITRQAEALDALIAEALGPGVPYDVLDCSCGIGTQALGLAARGHRVTGTDLSPAAAARAGREAAARCLLLATGAADMRMLPFRDAAFDVVVCADNSLPHLLTPDDVLTALGGMRRVLRPGGLLLLTTRPYDRLRAERPAATPPYVREIPEGRAVTFQLWHWDADGERYDFELFQLRPAADGEWTTRVRRARYWALTARQTTDFVERAGFRAAEWREPERTGYFQPVLIARCPPAPAKVTRHDDL
ncbi:class I SAM-dependent methyltransferase [Streptomyces sp. NPDC001514]